MSFDKLLLFWLLLFSVPLVYGQETFLDNYNSTSYSNNNSSSNFSANLYVNNDGDSPTGGHKNFYDHNKWKKHLSHSEVLILVMLMVGITKNGIIYML